MKQYTQTLNDKQLIRRLITFGFSIGPYAPTYAQIFDQFMGEFEIGIGILPVFLGTTKSGFVYDYEIYSPKHHEKHECFEEFERCARFAIEAALEMLEQDKK